MIRRLRFLAAYRRAALTERHRAAQAELDAARASLAASVADLDRSVESLRRNLLQAYRDRDEHGPSEGLDAKIAAAELALLDHAADPPASRRKDPNAPRRQD